MFYVGNNGVTKERDPYFQNLNINIANQLWDIVKEEPLNVQEEEIQFVSFEDALKELTALKNS